MGEKIEDVILFQIEQTSKQAKKYSQKELDRLGIDITVEQWILLKIVSETPALSQSELAERSLRDPASITRTLDILQRKKGLLHRFNEVGDRRPYRLGLTIKGDAFVNKHLSEIERQRRQSVSGLSKEEMMELSRMLKKIRENMT